MVQRQEIQNGLKEGRMFEDEVGVGALHWQREPDGPG